MDPALLQPALTAAVNASVAWLIGVVAAWHWLDRTGSRWQERAVERLPRSVTAALAVCIVGVMLSLWVQAALMSDLPLQDAAPALVEMLQSTHYGHAGLAMLAVLLAAGIAHWRLRATSGARRALAMLVLLLLLAAARVAAGHAFERGSVALAGEWLHLMLTGLWMGSVFVSGWIVLPCAAADNACGDYLRRLSNWAAVALAGIIATGAYNMYRVLNSPRDLLDGEYGHVLAFKLLFVLAAIALGGFNRFFGLPKTMAGEHPAALRQHWLHIVIRVLRLESIALFAALAAAAVLTNSAPPAG